MSPELPGGDPTGADRATGKRTGVRRVLGLLSGQRRWIAAGTALGFLAVTSNVALMAMSAFLISRAAVVTNVAELALAITTVRVLAIGRAVFRYLERYATHTATFRALTELRVWFYRAIEPLAPARLDTYRSGDLLARVSADIETLEDLSARVVVPPLVAAGTTAFACLLLGAFAPRLGLVLLVFLALAGVAVPLLARRLSRAAAEALVAERSELHAAFVDGIQGLAELVAYGRADEAWAETLAIGDAHDTAQARLARVRGLTAALVTLLATLAGVVVLALAIPQVTEGQLDGVYLALIPLAAIAAFEAVQPLTQSVQLLDGSRASAARLFELVDAAPAVEDPPRPVVVAAATAPRAGDASAVAPQPTALAPSSVSPQPTVAQIPDGSPRRGGLSLEVRGLRFAYEPGLPAVLDGLDLAVAAGERLAILGPSGAGKSTLVDLLLRFWDYAEGEIRIAGIELRTCRADDVRGLLGVVPQRIHLFDGTIRDNLALADADVTDERVDAALRAAQLDRFVASLPEGARTRVGEDGVRLSGGERQRLAIARVVVKAAPILVLDEATSDLDARTEASLLDSLEPFLIGRTVIIVTHRAAMAARADRSVVLEAGRARALDLGRAPD